jgi:hypothetical protein
MRTIDKCGDGGTQRAGRRRAGAARAAKDYECLPSAQELTEIVATKIADCAVQERPFPHIIIEGLLPAEFYDAVLRAIPPLSEFTVADYPGTGFGRAGNNYRDFGYAYEGLSEADGPLALLYAAFASEQFGRALLDKFSRPLPGGGAPIPGEKHRFFAGAARDYATVFALQVDMPGYAIPPHNDIPSKIVTFQLHLAEDSTLADYGTMLCEPRDSRAYRERPIPLRLISRAAGLLPPAIRGAVRMGLGGVFRRFERSRAGVAVGAGAWMPWEWFRVVKVARALPNHLLAFAPNDRSFHAVNFNVPADAPTQERRVVRGFIMSGRDAKNLIKPRPAVRAGRKL